MGTDMKSGLTLYQQLKEKILGRQYALLYEGDGDVYVKEVVQLGNGYYVRHKYLSSTKCYELTAGGSINKGEIRTWKPITPGPLTLLYDATTRTPTKSKHIADAMQYILEGSHVDSMLRVEYAPHTALGVTTDGEKTT